MNVIFSFAHFNLYQVSNNINIMIMPYEHLNFNE